MRGEEGGGRSRREMEGEERNGDEEKGGRNSNRWVGHIEMAPVNDAVEMTETLGSKGK